MDYTLQYYDLVLISVAASLVTGALVGYATPIALEVAILGLGAVAIAIIGHALFVNGPVDEVDDLADEVEIEKVPQALESAD